VRVVVSEQVVLPTGGAVPLQEIDAAVQASFAGPPGRVLIEP
jgi:hypothetical protein